MERLQADGATDRPDPKRVLQGGKPGEAGLPDAVPAVPSARERAGEGYLREFQHEPLGSRPEAVQACRPAFRNLCRGRADGDFVSLLRRLVVCSDEQMDLDGGRQLPVEPVRSDVRCKCGPVFGGRHRCDGQGNPVLPQGRRGILRAEDAEGRL